MNDPYIPAGIVVVCVGIVLAIAIYFKEPALHTRTVQTIQIDLDDEYERHLQQ